jgi:hypothetical protein
MLYGTMFGKVCREKLQDVGRRGKWINLAMVAEGPNLVRKLEQIIPS